MPELLLTNVDSGVLTGLQQRAARHGRSAEEEAKTILAENVRHQESADWSHVDGIYHRLAAAGHSFSDSAVLLREDRDR